MEEFLNLDKLSKETKGMTFHHIPIVILGATKVPMDNQEYHDALKVMQKLHKQTIKNSKNGKYICVDAFHTIQFEKPELIVETIKKFSKEVLS